MHARANCFNPAVDVLARSDVKCVSVPRKLVMHNSVVPNKRLRTTEPVATPILCQLRHQKYRGNRSGVAINLNFENRKFIKLIRGEPHSKTTFIK